MRRRRRRRLDTTPCTVVVESGRLVFWQGQQRGGELHNVPKHLAMRWLKQRWVRYIMEPVVGAGDARAAAARQPASDSVDRSPAAPPPQPPTFADEGAQQTTQQTTHPNPADEPPTTAHTTTPDKSAGQDGWEPSHSRPGHRDGPADFGPYRSQGFRPQAAQQPTDTAAELGEQLDDGRGEGARTRTRSCTNPYGPGRCPNCGSEVTGRRKWCDEACRLQAYRARS
jgi:type IV secretory pathway VirB10-like protein